MIINGKEISKQLVEQIKDKVQALSFKPLLVDVLVGEDPVSASYVRIKQKTALRAGIDFQIVQLPSEVTQQEVVTQILQLQNNPALCGLIVQLPLPPSLDSDAVLQAIDPGVDVDLLNPASSQRFYEGEADLIPPTPGAILHILQSLNLPDNLQYVVMGQGELVGKPITFLLKQRGQKVLIVDEFTQNPEQVLKQADILITGVGKPGIVKEQSLKPGVVVIDAGTSESSGAIKGDVDFTGVASKAKFITPVPGGVGPITVAKLLENVVLVAQAKN